MKKFISGCLVLLFLFFGKEVNAASTCDYKEQAELNNIASSVKADYSISQYVTDEEGNIRDDVKPEDVDFDNEFFIERLVKVSILNITNDIYVKVKSDSGIEKTYYMQDTKDGSIEFESGDLSSIINYEVTIFSNSENCKGTELRKIPFTTPMLNTHHYSLACTYYPNHDYCAELITVPFLSSDTEIEKVLNQKYEEKLEELRGLQQEEDKNLSFWEKISKFYKDNQTIIFVIIGIIIIAGVATTVIIVKKRRSRII